MTRSYTNAFEVVDRTQDLLIVPNQFGLINSLGLFGEQGITTPTVTFEVSEGTLAVIPDRVRGERNNANKGNTRKIYSLPTAHFPLDDFLSPEDLVGKRAYGSDEQDTEAEKIAEKLLGIRRKHALTLETARAYAITTGAVYTPSGTVANTSFYDMFGITRKSVDFVLGTAGTSIIEKAEEAVAHIMDNVKNGGTVNQVIALCSPEWFAKLIKHPTVVQAYQYYTSTVNPNRERVGGMSMYRQFEHGGVLYIEYRGTTDAGARFIPAGEAYFLPTGVDDMFNTYFSPASKMSLVGTRGESAYVFTYRDQKDEGIEIQSESNFLNLVKRPAAIVKATTSN